MDLDNAVRLLRDVAEQTGDWTDDYIDVETAQAEELRRAIRVVLTELRWWHGFADTVESLRTYSRTT